MGEYYDILFYYPRHFNRSDKGTNPYFEPFINACKRNSLNYLLVEEPAKGTTAPKNPAAIHFDFFFFIILVLRKLLPMYLFSHFETREHFIGKCINTLSLGKFKAPVYITISNSMGGILRGINKKARIFDYQHGIITIKQPGYFKNQRASDLMRLNHKEVLLHGEGFKQAFLKVDAEYYHDKIFVVGKAELANNKITKGNNIVVALQIIESEAMPEQWFSDQVDLLFEQFKVLEQTEQLGKGKIFLKHHPRSSKTYDISKLTQLPFVHLYDDSNEANSVALHITFFSTTTFEYASQGIPTLFLYSDHIPEGKTVFLEEFEYPYPQYRTIDIWLKVMADLEERVKVEVGLRNWYTKYYSAFNEASFLEIIKNV